MTPEEFRKAGHAIVDWVADYRERVAKGDLPVQSKVKPGEIIKSLPAAAPEKPEPFANILRDLDALILPGITHWQHPSFFGYFPTAASLSSVLGDLVKREVG
jgi:aromatic-L-amino-acid decarboxylase